LALLLRVRDEETAALLTGLLRAGDKALTRPAVQGLGTLPHPETPALLIEKFTSFDAPTQIDAVNTLATSAAGAKALLAAVKAKSIPATMLSPFLARQMDALKDEQVSALLKETFGDINAPKPDLEQRKKKFRAMLKPAELAKADVAKGRLIFTALCGQCHKLFGEGQNVGPDLTGSNRATLDYLLDNVLDPNAVIGKDYQLNIFELRDGRVASGVVKEESPAAYRIAMPGGLEQTVTASEVKKRTVAKVSTMPEGLFDALSQEQLQQVVAYLQSNASSPNAQKKPGGAARQTEGALEGESLKILETKGGKTKVQGMAGFGGRWSNGAQLWWTGGKPGDTLTLALPVNKAGKYQLKTSLTKARDYGTIEASLDGQPIEAAKLDLFHSPEVIITDELDWGTHDLTAGDHKLTIKITGANAQAVKSYMVGLDYLKLEPR
jgi:putative heme-binding domain-containing protein